MGRRKGRKWNQASNGTHIMTQQQLRDCYSINEHLGSENRCTEYKNGPGFIRHGFRENVAKYVCGFVNSQQNGKLLIGVNDDGIVTGYDCSHRDEDLVRREVDEAVKDLEPQIFPQDYSVRFVPVINEDGHQMGNLKVIEIIVNGEVIDKKDVLYQNKQGVFMRCDGSIQVLKGAAIQEWSRRKFQQRYQPEIDKLKKNEQNYVKDLQNKESEIRQLNEKLEQKNAAAQQLASNQENEEDLRNKDQKIRELEEELEKKNEAIRKMEETASVFTHVNEEQNGANGAEGNSEVIKTLGRLEDMLQKQQKSKICVIS
ncbi:schlafen-like protein 1 isoform X2 [Ruditapes philippinarum]|uniref:schlafen-like protein 1 isoform X2 n=1 Tax=Ruditapes philippinarum TaxID=129788 RepID=UPI00295B7170|nr:schlafen-like protein 1 isoform X2 [Ruditapes philippinarum]